MCRNIKTQFDLATRSARRLLGGLVTTAEPRNGEAEAAKIRARSVERFGATTM